MTPHPGALSPSASSPGAPRPRVLVVQHEEHTGPQLVGRWLDEAGVELEVCQAWAGDPVPARVEAGGLVVLGGAMGAHDDDVAPWLPAVRELLRTCVDDATPVLGICLGAQLLTVACGGQVLRGAVGPELGAGRVWATDEASSDPLFRLLPLGDGPLATRGVPAVQWHWDAMTILPPGAVLLGTGEPYPHQVFRLGGCAWGVQLHPEATLELVTSWATEDAAVLDAEGLDGPAAVAQVADAAAELVAAWRPMAAAFAAVVTARVGAGSGDALRRPEAAGAR